MDILLKTDWREELEEIPSAMIRGMLFGGDRFSCCDEAIVLKGNNAQLIGLTTIAPEGEAYTGIPTLVGLYVVPQYRRQGYGLQLLITAIKRCRERGFSKVRLDTLTPGMVALSRKIPSEYKANVEIVEFSLGFDLPD